MDPAILITAVNALTGSSATAVAVSWIKEYAKRKILSLPDDADRKIALIKAAENLKNNTEELSNTQIIKSLKEEVYDEYEQKIIQIKEKEDNYPCSQDIKH